MIIQVIPPNLLYMFPFFGSPTFVCTTGYSVTYDSFYKSFKARGDLVDDTMLLYALMFNEDAKKDAVLKPHIVKFMFNPYIAVST